MKKYIVSFLVASIFLAGAPFAVQQASASDLSIRDFVNLLIIIGVIPADKIPAVNAYLATLNDTPTSYNTTTPGRAGDSCPTGQVWSGSLHGCTTSPATKNQPTITKVSGLAADGSTIYAGERFSINGTNFSVPDSVYVGNELVALTQDANVIYAIAPTDLIAGSNYVYIKNSNGTSNYFNVTVFNSNSNRSSISITSVQSPAEDPNVLHTGEKATVYGTHLDTNNINVYIIGKAYDQTVSTYNPHYGSIDFTVPNIPDAGNYYLSLKQSDKESNKLNVRVVLPSPTCSLYSDKTSYKLGDTITYSWTSQNATYATFWQDNSGRDHINLPGDKLDSQGSQTVTANVIGNPSAKLLIYNSEGESSCEATVLVN